MQQPYRNHNNKIRAGLSGVVYLFYWLSVSLHHFHAGEHHHHAQKVCHAEPGEIHIHSEEYGATECHICQIAPISAEVSSVDIPAIFTAPILATSPDAGADILRPFPRFALSQPRAPPAA